MWYSSALLGASQHSCSSPPTIHFTLSQNRIFNEDVILDARESFDDVNGGTVPLAGLLRTLGGERRAAVMTDKVRGIVCTTLGCC